MGPCEHDCPIKFLDLVTEDCKTSHYPDFEKNVREHAKKRNDENTAKRKVNLEYGDQVFFDMGLKYGRPTEVWSIKISYQFKRVIAGYGYDMDGKAIPCLGGLLRLPNICHWRKVVKVNGEVIEVTKQIESTKQPVQI
jgi:hypothetical protein